MQVEIPDEGYLGPAMKALPSDKMRHFVVAYCETGGTNAARAAIAAGYSVNNVDAAKVSAHRLLHDERIQAALREEGSRRLGAGVIAATSVLVETIQNESVGTKDRLRAVEMLLNRTGLPASTEVKHTIVHQDETEEGLLRRLAAAAKVLGVDPQKFLGHDKIEDAEFTEVEEDWSAL